MLHVHPLEFIYYKKYIYKIGSRGNQLRLYNGICTYYIFFINQQFRTCASAFPNEFTVRSYEYWVGQYWILSWMEENQTVTYFLCSRLFTYFNYNISLWFFKSKFRSYIGKHFLKLKQRPVCLSKLNSKLKTWIVSVVLLIGKYSVDTVVSPKT